MSICWALYPVTCGSRLLDSFLCSFLLQLSSVLKMVWFVGLLTLLTQTVHCLQCQRTPARRTVVLPLNNDWELLPKPCPLSFSRHSKQFGAPQVHSLSENYLSSVKCTQNGNGLSLPEESRNVQCPFGGSRQVSANHVSEVRMTHMFGKCWESGALFPTKPSRMSL